MTTKEKLRRVAALRKVQVDPDGSADNAALIGVVKRSRPMQKKTAWAAPLLIPVRR